MAAITEPKKKVFNDVRERATDRFAAASIATTVLYYGWGLPTYGAWQKKFFPKAVNILDSILVVDYIQLATAALQKDKKKARGLAYTYLKTILQGRVNSVITSLRICLTKNRIRGRRWTDIQKAITYFENHKDFMRYDEYLVAGYPIATGRG